MVKAKVAGHMPHSHRRREKPPVHRARIAYYHPGMEQEYYLQSHIHGEVLRGIRAACQEESIGCVFLDKRSIFSWGDFDGYLGTVPSYAGPVAGRCWDQAQRRYPCVNMLVPSRRPSSNYVGTDESIPVEMLLRHLNEKGHRGIDYFSFEREAYSLARYECWVKWRRREGMPCRALWRPGFSLVPEIQRKPAMVDRLRFSQPLKRVDPVLTPYFDAWCHWQDRAHALIFESDYYALSFMTYAADRGLSIPGDVAVAGIDNNLALFPKMTNDCLTTIGQDFYTIGLEGARSLIEIMRRPAIKGIRLHVTPSLVVRRSTEAHPSADGFQEMVRSYIAAHLDEPESLRKLCRHAGLSQNYFLAKFKKRFRQSFVAYVNFQRIDLATRLLRTGNQSITEIAFAVGFGTHQHFCRVFRRTHGVSPGEYRQKNTTRRNVQTRHAHL
jgi:AraC-like DNA-binding protein